MGTIASTRGPAAARESDLDFLPPKSNVPVLDGLICSLPISSIVIFHPRQPVFIECFHPGHRKARKVFRTQDRYLDDILRVMAYVVDKIVKIARGVNSCQFIRNSVLQLFPPQARKRIDFSRARLRRLHLNAK